MKVALMRWMNRRHLLALWLILAVGYLFHLGYEVWGHVHEGKAIEWAYLAGRAAVVWVGAGLAGWAIDLYFTKSEEEAGELQPGPESQDQGT